MMRSNDDNLFNDANHFDCDNLDAARHYDPETGRWLNVEPIGYEAGVNLYRYVGNAPCNDSDPTAHAVPADPES